MAILKSDIVAMQQNLARERYLRGVTQQELADAIGITQGHLSYIESGKRDLTVQRYVQIRDYFDQLR